MPKPARLRDVMRLYDIFHGATMRTRYAVIRALRCYASLSSIRPLPVDVANDNIDTPRDLLIPRLFTRLFNADTLMFIRRAAILCRAFYMPLFARFDRRRCALRDDRACAA